MMRETKIFEKLKARGFPNAQIYYIIKKLNKNVKDANYKSKNENENENESIMLFGSTFFSSESGRIILRFCTNCGSTKILCQMHYIYCENCGTVLEENYYY